MSKIKRLQNCQRQSTHVRVVRPPEMNEFTTESAKHTDDAQADIMGNVYANMKEKQIFKVISSQDR